MRGAKFWNLEKPGVCYQKIRSKMKTLDLIMFRGTDFVSDFISRLQEYVLGEGAGEYTHVGVVFLGRDFPEFSPYHNQNAIYVFESTQGGYSIGDGVCDLNGQSRLGVQLRCLDKLAEIYDSHPNSKMGWCRLKQDVKIDPKFLLNVFRRYNELDYDLSIIDLLAAAFPLFRPLRSHCFEIFQDQESWQFCSELAANIYKDFGILDEDLVADDVLPADFAETFPGSGRTFDRDEAIPVLFEPAVLFTTRKLNEVQT